VPAESATEGASAGINGESDDPIGYNLDAFFYSEGCDPLGSLQSGAPNEAGPMPAGTRYVVVDQPLGLDTQVSLAVTH
jgi:hypothetical protein